MFEFKITKLIENQVKKKIKQNIKHQIMLATNHLIIRTKCIVHTVYAERLTTWKTWFVMKLEMYRCSSKYCTQSSGGITHSPNNGT